MKTLFTVSSVEWPYSQASLHRFWGRSQGLWLSKLAKVSLRLLEEQELQGLQQIHSLEHPAFGIRMAWEYQMKPEVGQMMWCVDATQPHVIFADRNMADSTSLAVYRYEMVEDQTLITTNGENEERTVLEGDSRRVRELRASGRLVKRLWESRFSA